MYSTNIPYSRDEVKRNAILLNLDVHRLTRALHFKGHPMDMHLSIHTLNPSATPSQAWRFMPAIPAPHYQKEPELQNEPKSTLQDPISKINKLSNQKEKKIL